MNGLKKTLNVFGIILAWFLSVALVVLLIVAPTALSALSLLDPDTITDAVWSVLEAEQPSAAAPEKSYGITSLSAKKADKTSNATSAEKILGELDVSKIEEIIGEDIDEDVLNKVLASDAVKELVDAYTDDVMNVITGNADESKFDADKIIEIVEDNIDEIAEIVQEIAPDLSAEDVKNLKSEIKTAVRENAEDIVEAIPAPEEIREMVVGSNPEAELALELLAQRDAFKLIIVAAIVLLSLLIFLFRIPGFRGFRWLSVDLFVAGGFGALICIAWHLGSSVAMGMLENVAELEMLAVNDVVKNVLSAFTRGVTIRTAIIFAAAVVLMIVYVLIKKLREKKAARQAVPVFAPAAPQMATADVAVDMPQESAPSAEE